MRKNFTGSTKYIFLGIIFFSLFTSPLVLSLKGTQANAEELAPIYVSIVTHNEESSSGRYPNFTNDESAFWEHREAVVAFADMLKEEGVSYNWQSAWTFLEAARDFDDGTTSTGGKNIVEYLQDLGFSVNVHGHVGAYSYADDAYLIDQLGDAPSGIMGGFVATPSEDAEVEDFWDTQTGDVYSYSWTPTALWGAASFGHRNDEDVEASGIWNPKNNAHFLTHDDSAPIPVIGGFTSDWEGLETLLALQDDGVLDPNVMHTAAIMVDQDELLTESEREDIRERIQSLADETAEGRIIWMGLEDVLETWESEYNSVPSIFMAAGEAYEEITTTRTSEPEVRTGSLIKTACTGNEAADDPCKAVYYLGSNGNRHAFPNEKVYFTWYDNFDDVETISTSAMASYRLGENVTYHPGTRMVKFSSVNTVYAVEKGGILRAVGSESIAEELYGSTWNQQIDDISEAFYGNYTIGESLTDASDYDVSDAQASVDSIDDNFSSDSSAANNPDAYITFNINTQDFAYPELSVDILNQIIDLHETYDLPVDIYLTTTMVDLYEDLSPELLERMKTSSVVAVDYHTRPPLPYHYSGDYDWIGLAEMTEDEQYDTIMEYETHGLDLVTGNPTEEDGGYAYLAEVLGYAPPIASILGSTTQTRIAREVYGDLGATFTIDHGSTYNFGDTKNGLYLRPEHYDLRLFEHVGTSDIEGVIENAYEEALDAEDGIAPYVIGVKMHDNDFFAENSAWTTVYQTYEARTEGPPYDTSLTSDLLSDTDADAMWELYEDTVEYVVSQSDRFTVINAFDLQEMIQDY